MWNYRLSLDTMPYFPRSQDISIRYDTITSRSHSQLKSQPPFRNRPSCYFCGDRYLNPTDETLILSNRYNGGDSACASYAAPQVYFPSGFPNVYAPCVFWVIRRHRSCAMKPFSEIEMLFVRHKISIFVFLGDDLCYALRLLPSQSISGLGEWLFTEG